MKEKKLTKYESQTGVWLSLLTYKKGAHSFLFYKILTLRQALVKLVAQYSLKNNKNCFFSKKTTLTIITMNIRNKILYKKTKIYFFYVFSLLLHCN